MYQYSAILLPQKLTLYNRQTTFQILPVLHELVCVCSFMQFFTYVDSCNHSTIRIQNCLSPQRSFVLPLINLLIVKPPRARNIKPYEILGWAIGNFYFSFIHSEKTAFVDFTAFGCHCLLNTYSLSSAYRFTPLTVFNRVTSLNVVYLISCF